MLHIHNTLTRRKEPFRPLRSNRVGMYVCGMTVYDYCHLGHARMLLVFDVVARYLRHRGYRLTYVRNITDIDDKIIARANENGEPFEAVTERFIAAMHEDCEALGILPPDREPRATEYVDGMLDLIADLEDKGYAYLADGGDVCFRVDRFPEYGKLSGNRVEALRAGARVEVDENKASAVDFVLWKAAKPGEPSWPSHWGPGRPGWHIECSAMSMANLGEEFDIHGGGADLVFPHHECEIAQSEASTGRRFARVWMHNAFVRIDGDKMSKSLGNFFTIRDILARHSGETVRYYLLTSHYRSPLNHAPERLEEAEQSLRRLYGALRGLPDAPDGARVGGPGTVLEDRFHKAMDDDFNTPEALAALHELATEVNRRRSRDPRAAAGAAAVLRRAGSVLGLLGADPDSVFQEAPSRAVGSGAAGTSGDPSASRPSSSTELPPDEIERRIAARAAARRGEGLRGGGPDPGRAGGVPDRARGRPRGNHMAAFGMIPVSCRRAGGVRRRGMAQSGSAPALGAGGRGFKSLYPDHSSGPRQGRRARPAPPRSLESSARSSAG